MARNKGNCGNDCATAPVAAATGNVPDAPQAARHPRPAAPSAKADVNRQATAFGIPLPRVPVPGVVARSAETVLDGAQSVTGWVMGLVRRP